ncbi:MAG TPA: hypothetical protein VK426_01620 [Methanobacterium sp.]|nr:hypothetical protein [Methanobacterium sp.]
MSYVICGKCGGYYKLQEGESFEDFDKCQCGGNLSYAKYIPKTVPKTRKKPKNYIKCRICGHEQEKTLVCSKCGSKIRLTGNNQNRNYRNRYDYRNVENDLLDRIEWSGIVSGVIFYILVSLFIGVINIFFTYLAVYLVWDRNVTNVFLVMGVISAVFALIYILIPIASGYIAVSKITTEDYVTGLVNGGVVGVILGIIGIIIILFSSATTMWITNQVNIGIIELLILIIPTMITRTVSTAFGGLIAVYIKRRKSYILKI